MSKMKFSRICYSNWNRKWFLALQQTRKQYLIMISSRILTIRLERSFSKRWNDKRIDLVPYEYRWHARHTQLNWNLNGNCSLRFSRELRAFSTARSSLAYYVLSFSFFCCFLSRSLCSLSIVSLRINCVCVYTFQFLHQLLFNSDEFSRLFVITSFSSRMLNVLKSFQRGHELNHFIFVHFFPLQIKFK